jgi:membrane protein
VTATPGRLGKGRATVRLFGAAAWRGLVGFLSGDSLTYAASIAYHSLLSLFPALLLAGALLGRATADPGQRATILAFALRYFPAQFDFITRQLDAFRTDGATFGVTGTVALVWGAVGVFGAIIAAVDHAWGVEVPRGFVGHRLLSFLMLAAAGVIMLAALAMISATQVADASWFAAVIAYFPGLLILRSFAARQVPTLMYVLVVGLVYYSVPSTKVRFRDVWMGAIVAGLLWKLAIGVFSWYVRDISWLSRINQSVAVVIVFLVWVYSQAVILLYGAEFTAAYARLRGDR